MSQVQASPAVEAAAQAAVAAAQPASPAPPPAQPPPQPAPQQPQPQTAEPVRQTLDPNMPVAVAEGFQPTVQQMADVALAAHQGQVLTPEQANEFNLLQKALKENDRDAARQVMELYDPAPAQQVATPEQQQVLQLQQKIDQLTEIVQNQSNVTQRVTQREGEQWINNQLGTDAGKQAFPLLSAIPSRVQKVNSQLRDITDMLKLNGQDPATFTPHQREQMAVLAFKNAEKELMEVGSLFGQQPTSQAQPVQMIDDQNRFQTPQQRSDSIRGQMAPVHQQRGLWEPPEGQVKDSNFKVINGQLVDMRNQQILRDQMAANGAKFVPQQTMQLPTGQSVQPYGQTDPQVAATTTTGMQAAMRQRLQSVL